MSKTSKKQLLERIEETKKQLKSLIKRNLGDDNPTQRETIAQIIEILAILEGKPLPEV